MPLKIHVFKCAYAEIEVCVSVSVCVCVCTAFKHTQNIDKIASGTLKKHHHKPIYSLIHNSFEL